jgi:hypothetical protein
MNLIVRVVGVQVGLAFDPFTVSRGGDKPAMIALPLCAFAFHIKVDERGGARSDAAMILIFRRITFDSITMSGGRDEKGITTQRSSVCIPIEVDKLLGARSNAALILIFCVGDIAFGSFTVSGGGDKQALATLRVPVRCVPAMVDELFRARSNTAMLAIVTAPVRVTFGSFTVSRGGDKRAPFFRTTHNPRVVCVFRILVDELGGALSDAAMILIFLGIAFDPVTVSCGGDEKGITAQRSSLWVPIKVAKFLHACSDAAVTLIFQGGIAGIAFGSFTVSGGGNKQAVVALRVTII